MKKYALLIGLLFFFSISTFAQNDKIQILETGGFHSEEVSVKDGETWLGLFHEGNSFLLLPSVLTVEEQDDETEIKVLGRERPVFLIRGQGFLQSRVVPTVFSGADVIENDFDRSFEFSGEKYRLMVENEATDQENPKRLNSTSKLILTNGKTSQILYSIKRCDFCVWQINWAGDLDGDGKLDLYLYLTDHYNVANLKLFLSSAAENGKLVKDVATLTTTGC